MAKLSKAFLDRIKRFAIDDETGEEFEVEMSYDEKEDWLRNGRRDDVLKELRVFSREPGTKEFKDSGLSEVEKGNFLDSARKKIDLRVNLDEKGNRKQGKFDKFVDDHFKPSTDEPMLIGAVKLAFYLELKLISSIWEGIQIARTSSERKEMKREKEQELKQRAKRNKEKAKQEKSRVEEKYEKRIKELEEKLAEKNKPEAEKQAEKQAEKSAEKAPEKAPQSGQPQQQVQAGQPQQQVNQQNANQPQANQPQMPAGSPQANQNMDMQAMITQLIQMMLQYMTGQQAQNNAPQAQGGMQVNPQMLQQLQGMLNMMQGQQRPPQNQAPVNSQRKPEMVSQSGPQINIQSEQPVNRSVKPGPQPKNVSTGTQTENVKPGPQPKNVTPGPQPENVTPGPLPENVTPGPLPKNVSTGTRTENLDPAPQPKNVKPAPQPKKYVPPKRTEADNARVAEVNTALGSRAGIEQYLNGKLSSAGEEADSLSGVRSALQTLARDMENNPGASHLELMEGLRREAEAYLADHAPIDAKNKQELSDILSVRAIYNAMTDAKVEERLRVEKEDIVDNVTRENLLDDDSLVELKDALKAMPPSPGRDRLIDSIGELREEMVNNPEGDHLAQLHSVMKEAGSYMEGAGEQKPDFSANPELKQILESVDRVRQKDHVDERLAYRNHLTQEGVKNTLRELPAGANDSPEFTKLRDSLKALDAAYSEEDGPNKEMHIANARRKAALAAEQYALHPEQAPTVGQNGRPLSAEAAAEARQAMERRLEAARSLSGAYNTLQREDDQKTIEGRQEELRQEREERRRELEERARIRSQKEAELNEINAQRSGELRNAVSLEREEAVLNKEIDSRQKGIDELERDNVRLTQELETATRDFEAARNEFTDVVNELNQLGNDDNTLKADREQLEADKRALEAEVLKGASNKEDAKNRSNLRNDMKSNSGNIPDNPAPGARAENKGQKWLGNDDLDALSNALGRMPGVGGDLRTAIRGLKEAGLGGKDGLPAQEYVRLYEEAKKFTEKAVLNEDMRGIGITGEQLANAKQAAGTVIDKLDANNRYKNFKAIVDFQKKIVDFNERARQLEERERRIRERELKQNERNEKTRQAEDKAIGLQEAKNKKAKAGRDLQENAAKRESAERGKRDLESRRDELTSQRKQSMERAKRLRAEARNKKAELNGNNRRNENVM